MQAVIFVTIDEQAIVRLSPNGLTRHGHTSCAVIPPESGSSRNSQRDKIQGLAALTTHRLAAKLGDLMPSHLPTLQSAENLYLYLSAPSGADKVLLSLPPNRRFVVQGQR